VKGTLYIVSTPIGNLEDVTLRALRVLKEVDIIAAEDTRHSLKLLNHYCISKPLMSFWRQRENTRTAEVIERLHSGQSVALISDAGTPGISDPGALLIKKAIAESIKVVSIPGPSALIAAMSLSGLPTEEFTFIGFLPSQKGQRHKVLKDLSLEPRTLILFEAPHRIIRTLKDMEEIFEERKAAVVKEITKIHEGVLRGSISEILSKLEKTKIAGEYVIILEGKSEGKQIITNDILSEINSLMAKGLKRKEAVKKIADAYKLSKKELYDKSLTEYLDFSNLSQ
jgi:16S rRNA (cytidine1402-2'-O)-methyltransferase